MNDLGIIDENDYMCLRNVLRKHELGQSEPFPDYVPSCVSY